MHTIKKIINHYNNVKNSKNNKELREYLKDIPNKLYKYREFNDNNLNAITNDYIWMSTADKFLDKEDTTLKFHLNNKDEFLDLLTKNMDTILWSIIQNKAQIISVKENLKEMLRHDKVIKAKSFFDKNGNVLTDEIKVFLKDTGFSNNKIKEVLRTFKKIESKDFQLKFKNKVKTLFKTINEKVKKRYYIQSFSESYDISSMWENYANKNEGFCVEYNIEKIKDSIEFSEYDKLLLIVPIIYGERLEIDIKSLFELAFLKMDKQSNLNLEEKLENDIIISIITKKEEYSFEKEWRLLVDKNNLKDNILPFEFVSAIYLGDEIKTDWKNELIELSKRKRIKLFQRKFNEYNNQYEYEKINVF